MLKAVFGYPMEAGGGPLRRWFARAAAAAAGRDASHIPWVPGGRLLEVGSGRGAVLAEYRQLGWEVVGVEPAARGVELARLTGLDVRLGKLGEQSFPIACFDAVVLNHVLEHVSDPRSLLAEVHRVLKPGGWILVRLPNAESWEARVYREDWWSWELPRHLIHFSPPTLHMVLAAAGFRIVRMRTELRPANLGLNARWAAHRRWGRRIDPRLFTAVLLPLGAAASWRGRGGDLAALAQRMPDCAKALDG
ncbi:MAG: class I SAM-dependent methyltransferase [Candidatus Dormibacteraeota bacterium]|uniref:Class I SAM-dependent methyltransferase n=2 Tax=Candidatus Aeolococcus gillhamiae TaxID=3127015 RepID=A0A934N571_9BACT|nr:class I SAM-dependent methyltransferase [Candidatus Dormibacteraeota bacterium]